MAVSDSAPMHPVRNCRALLRGAAAEYHCLWPSPGAHPTRVVPVTAGLSVPGRNAGSIPPLPHSGLCQCHARCYACCGSCKPSAAAAAAKSEGGGAVNVTGWPVLGCFRVRLQACNAWRPIQGPCKLAQQSRMQKCAKFELGCEVKAVGCSV